ncbi:metallophosphoesterase [Sphingopyxis macrogoltabida]|uniref:Phosphohydrolase n=1 Tax=Sphingopyxis macrogoltabida TaxID=33050 RepID=A0AAC9AUS5_SPHMC|nr:metallophosphoesterase [Sphingopyxis macrogoltabida]ALJ12148.1 phosphohydrolase [Sphingopyxis macrogoltabida]AMU88324.1 phosphohydrolase [Sphingopyxis macrogoltabida]
MTKSRRRWRRWVALLALLGAALLAKGYWNATRDPVIRTATVGVAGWPAGQPPLRLLLLSDIHVAGPDMPPERLERIVGELNRLKPDLVLIAGDLVSEKRTATHIYTAGQVVAPLAGLRAPLGVVVAPGNHDHWFKPDALRGEMEKLGLRVLQNEAIRRGPLIVGGVDDDFSGHDDIAATFAAMDRLGPGVPLLLTHSPDIVPDLPRPVAAVFAGHTHCGQIRFPVVGAISYVSRYGDRFACGDMVDGKQRVFVGAGLGTSIVPLRYLTPPDIWLVTVGPSGKE